MNKSKELKNKIINFEKNNAKDYQYTKNYNNKEINKNNEMDNNNINKISNKTRSPLVLIFEVSAGIVVGVILGMFIDRFLHTQPIFLIIFTILCFIATIYNLYKYS
jgi:F0F1-type ATP synthase assembly protein I